MITLKTAATWLVIIGGLNWGLVGALNYDLVASLLGGGDATQIIPKIIYIVVGLSAIYLAVDQLSKKS